MASRLPSPSHLRAWRALMQVHASVTEALERELEAAQHLPLAWYELLVTLRQAGGRMRMHLLADHLTLSRSATTRFVDRVESAGLVARSVCPTDRRGMEVALTEAGRRAQRRAAPVILRGVQRHFGRYLHDQQAELMAEALAAVLAGEGKAVSLLDAS